MKNELLVTHQSWTNKGTHIAYIAPYKATEVDDEGTLRLKWWAGNEHLKSAQAPAPSLQPHAPHYFTRHLSLTDISNGVVLEAQLTMPSADTVDWPGFVLELAGGRAPLAVVILPGAEQVAVGDYLPQSAVPWRPGGKATLPTTDWMFSGGASSVGTRDPHGSGDDIRSGGPGQVSLARLAHPLDGQGHMLSAAHVCFTYVAGYGCGPSRKGPTVTLVVLDALDGSIVSEIWTSAPLTNYSFDHFTSESPPVCGGASGLALGHGRQVQLALRFSNAQCNLQLPMRTMNASVAWGGIQPGPYSPATLPSVGVTERWP